MLKSNNTRRIQNLMLTHTLHWNCKKVIAFAELEEYVAKEVSSNSQRCDNEWQGKSVPSTNIINNTNNDSSINIQ